MNRTEINKKQAGIGPFKKTSFVTGKCCSKPVTHFTYELARDFPYLTTRPGTRLKLAKVCKTFFAQAEAKLLIYNQFHDS